MIISIIIPVFNLEGYISRCLEAIFSQDLDSVEVIIVNDGSTDNSLNEIRTVIDYFKPENVLVLNVANKGVSSARNLGLVTARGDYIYFLDGDDIVSQDFLKSTKFIISSQSPEMLIFGFNTTKPDLEILQRYEDRFNFPDELISNTDLLNRRLDDKILVCVGTVIYKRDVLQKHSLQLHEGTSYGEDLELFLKYCSCVKNVHVVSKVLLNYVQRPLSAMNNKRSIKYDAITSLERVVAFWEHNYIDAHLIKKLHSVFIPIALLRMAMEAVEKKMSVEAGTLIRKDMMSRLDPIVFCEFRGRRKIHYLLLKILRHSPRFFTFLIQLNVATKKRFRSSLKRGKSASSKLFSKNIHARLDNKKINSHIKTFKLFSRSDSER
jgi:glycosyltransferase involved in cell wall biosynthesis